MLIELIEYTFYGFFSLMIIYNGYHRFFIPVYPAMRTSRDLTYNRQYWLTVDEKKLELRYANYPEPIFTEIRREESLKETERRVMRKQFPVVPQILCILIFLCYPLLSNIF